MEKKIARTSKIKSWKELGGSEIARCKLAAPRGARRRAHARGSHAHDGTSRRGRAMRGRVAVVRGTCPLCRAHVWTLPRQECPPLAGLAGAIQRRHNGHVISAVAKWPSLFVFPLNLSCRLLCSFLLLDYGSGQRAARLPGKQDYDASMLLAAVVFWVLTMLLLTDVRCGPNATKMKRPFVCDLRLRTRRRNMIFAKKSSSRPAGCCQCWS